MLREDELAKLNTERELFSEQLHELLYRDYPIPTAILEETGSVMKLIVDKVELKTCLPNMAKTFTQHLVDIAE